MGDPAPHVVVIGGGFGGIRAARRLRKAAVRVTLIDRRNHHLFQPLLYQVATAGLGAADIAYPIRKMLRKQKNCTVYMADVVRIDRRGRHVYLRDGEVVSYDALVVSTGVTHNYFGNFAWLVWVVVHIMFLVGFRNRFVVFWEWIWAYFSYSRSARIILEQPFKTVAERDDIPEITEAYDHPAADEPSTEAGP